MSSSGRRERRFFEIKADAEEFGRQQRIRVTNFGTSSVSLPPGRVEEAAIAFDLLQEFPEVTLTAVVREFIERNNAATKSVTLEEAFRQYTVFRPCLSAPYRQQMRQTLARCLALKGTVVTAITHHDIAEVLAGSPPAARNAFIRILSVVFNFAVKREWVKENPIKKVDRAQIRRTEICVLTINQTRSLLAACVQEDPKLIPYHAFGLFAGIRPAELTRMSWEHVHLVDAEIKLPPDVTKTRTGRTIKVEAVLASWIEYFEKKIGRLSGTIVPTERQRARLRNIRDRAGVRPWIQDVMRHSYASHWLKAYEDKNKLLGYMGHTSDDMLLNNYLRAVDKRTAAEYWALHAPPPR